MRAWTIIFGLFTTAMIGILVVNLHPVGMGPWVACLVSLVAMLGLAAACFDWSGHQRPVDVGIVCLALIVGFIGPAWMWARLQIEVMADTHPPELHTGLVYLHLVFAGLALVSQTLTAIFLSCLMLQEEESQRIDYRLYPHK